ncbi:MAG: SMI1/KNR4 family protein [Verrucomicrobiota bacterium]
MNYRGYFDKACGHLVKIGIEPAIREGRPVSEEELTLMEQRIQFPLPDELKAYLAELGDGFSLSYSAEPITGKPEDVFWWCISFLSDIEGDFQAIRHDMLFNANGGGHSCKTEACIEESRRRLNWIPIFGIGGGGYTFCIDAGAGGAIRYHDIRMGDHYFPSVHLADGLDDWMRNWSRYCFSQPHEKHEGGGGHCFLESYCWEMDGRFDWSPSRFRPEFDCRPFRE